MTKKKEFCEKCGGYYSKNNIKKHIISCDGVIRNNKKMMECPYCGTSFYSFSTSEKGNHVRWCENNPKKDKYVLDAKKRLKKTQKECKIDYKAIGIKIKKLHGDGVYDNAKKLQKENPFFLGKKHTEKTKKVLKEKALSSNHRRLVRSIRSYVKKDGSVIILDSSWEVELAKRLDSLNVKWERPSPLKWKDKEGVEHNYFPDFFLTEYNIFLDPKNPQARKVQEEKINKIKETYENVVFIWSLEDVKNFTPCSRHWSSKPVQ